MALLATLDLPPEAAFVSSLALLAGAALAVPGLRRLRRPGPAPQGPPRDPRPGRRPRAEVLEEILAVAARLNATRQLPELIDGALAAFAAVSGCERTVLFLWSHASSTFQMRGAVGLTPAECTAVARSTPTAEAYAAESRDRGRGHGCFLVGAAGQQAPVPGGPWPAGAVLRVPLLAADGDALGYLDLQRPVDGALPDHDEQRGLAFLARQTSAAIESVRLNERLATNNAELSRASAKLASLADMKANFVANVSHELRTPLTSISAYTELLQQNLAAMPPEALAEFLKVIHTESGKLAAVINDLLELGQMESGRPVLHRSEVELTGLVARLQDGWQGRAAERGLALAVQLPPGPLYLAADPVLLQQLLTHLVANALKFTPEGGRIRVAAWESGSAIRFEVEDTGIGIPADELGVIFDKFYQVDGSATREHNGQGVGLAICHEIVAHHDGRIWAENVPEGGARFTVLLPRRAPVAQALRQRGAAAAFETGEFLERLVHWLAESLGVQTVTLMEPLPDGEHLGIRAALGLSDAVVQGTRVHRGAGIAGTVWATGRTISTPDITREGRFDHTVSEPRFSTPSVLCVPLVGAGGVRGVVTVNNRVDGRPLDDHDRLQLEALAPRVAEALEQHDAWCEATRALGELRMSMRTTTAVGHPRHESLPRLCLEVGLAAAARAGLPEAERRHLAFAFPFYDAGMGTVPPPLLAKPEPLAPEEQAIMQRHVEASLEILAPLNPAPEVRRIILHHHENHDGTGYPAGLAGEEIPPGARVLRLVDSLGALLSPRPWRPALELDEALAELERGAGRAYSPELVGLVTAEVRARAERFSVLQAAAADAGDLARPLLDRRGMVPVG
ncbi:MAG TPA: ATP-binding protein [Candidatus Krumholzibacteria bacterium]|nr:ATP-binding protein [Candidatus Krumholzibacteria bacterium]